MQRLSPPLPEAFLASLELHGDQRAVIAGDRTVTHRELADEAAAFAEQLGPGRRLVLLTGGNDLPSLIAYLGVITHGHVALMAGGTGDHLDRLIEVHRPDTVVQDGTIASHAALPGHDLHPDLALLLSTSGSTGSPKLVRLSHQNLRTNAEAIAAYLQIDSSDLAATTLPTHYCYGLSVLHSHLHRGAAVLLTENSVVDPCFWDAVREHRVTSFAGVPYTFEMLDRIGFDGRNLPHLRHITQAGGRLAPDRVQRFAQLGRERGFDFVVMYGATEATARMAWLPPHLAVEHPDAIGIPVPGGRFEIQPLADHPDGTGELVFHGPNVMMGYAETPGDLSLGSTIDALHTGDIARRGDDGLYRIVGRRSRFAKVFGLRIDLDEAERTLAENGIAARCADGHDHLVVGTTDTAADVIDRIERVARTAWGLPAGAVAVAQVAEFPRLANDKVDHRALVALAAPATRAAEDVNASASVEERIRSTYASVLRRGDVTGADSFTGLGGDSLSYVEASLRLEAVLGDLPAGWHLMPIRDLAAIPVSAMPRRGWRALETSVALRALAIVAIVATHGNLLTLLGGAHLLVGISGYNYARFRAGGTNRERIRAQLQSLSRIVVPSVVWIAMITLVFGTYPWRTVFLVNGLLGPPGWAEPAWHFWFIEALVVILVCLTLLSCVPVWRRLDARWPFWLPVALACAALLTRYELWEPRGGDDIHRAHMLFWIFAIGWAIARADATWQRWVVTVLVLAVVPGFFENPAREGFVAAGLLALLWIRQVRVPAPVAPATATLASASLYIYLTHWQIYPLLENRVPLLALLASLAVGIAVATLVQRLPVMLQRTPSTAASSAAGSKTGTGPATRPTRTRVPTG